MTVNRTTLLDLPLPVTGTESGTWGDTTNNGLTQYLDIAIAGSLVLSADSDTTLSSTEGDSSATNIGGTTAQYAVLRCTGARTTTRNINAPAWAISGGTISNYSKTYVVINDTTGGQSIVLRATNSATPTYTTGVTIVAGERAVCAWNGSDFVKVGGAAGGSNTQVQYNNNGVFGGSADLTWDGSTLATTGLTASGAVTLSATSQNIALGTSQVGGTWTAGGASQTGAITLDQSTKTHTLNIGTGATENALTKTINLGTAGVSGSTTAINIGSAVSGATTNVTLNGTVQPGVVISGSSSGNALRITQTGAGNALLVEDDTNPDSSPFVVTAAGDVGIGTSSPAVRLDVAGRAQFTNSGFNYVLVDSTLSDSYFRLAAGGAVKWYFRNNISNSNALEITPDTGSSSGLYLTQAGNLGLGVTPSAWASTYKAVEVNALGNALTTFSTSGNLILSSNAYFDATDSRWEFARTGSYAGLYTIKTSTGEHTWNTSTASGTANTAITFTQAMTLDASGNLLVGTTASVNDPAMKVQLNASSGSVTYFGVNRDGNNYGLIMGYDYTANDYAFVRTVQAKPLMFGTTNTERARITSDGNLLVGVTTVAAEGGFTLYPQGSSGAPLLVWNRASTTNTTTAADFRNASTSVGNITYTNTATAYNTSSDYRLKDNPQPLTGSGAFIDALKPKTWNWKANGSKGVGFIAHEVQKVSPGSVVGEKDGEQMQTMEYGSAEFIANIIAELQSLRQRVAELEGK